MKRRRNHSLLPATPAEQVQQLLSEIEEARSDFFAKYREAKTDDERSKLVEELYPLRKSTPRSFWK